MTRKKQNSAKAHGEEVKEALLFFQSEFTRLRRKSFNLRARRGHRLMGELLQSFDLDRLKKKITKFLRDDTPQGHYRGYSITDFFKTTMRAEK